MAQTNSLPCFTEGMRHEIIMATSAFLIKKYLKSEQGEYVLQNNPFLSTLTDYYAECESPSNSLLFVKLLNLLLLSQQVRRQSEKPASEEDQDQQEQRQEEVGTLANIHTTLVQLSSNCLAQLSNCKDKLEILIAEAQCQVAMLHLKYGDLSSAADTVSNFCSDTTTQSPHSEELLSHLKDILEYLQEKEERQQQRGEGEEEEDEEEEEDLEIQLSLQLFFDQHSLEELLRRIRSFVSTCYQELSQQLSLVDKIGPAPPVSHAHDPAPKHPGTDQAIESNKEATPPFAAAVTDPKSDPQANKGAEKVAPESRSDRRYVSPVGGSGVKKPTSKRKPPTEPVRVAASLQSDGERNPSPGPAPQHGAGGGGRSSQQAGDVVGGARRVRRRSPKVRIARAHHFSSQSDSEAQNEEEKARAAGSVEASLSSHIPIRYPKISLTRTGDLLSSQSEGESRVAPPPDRNGSNSTGAMGIGKTSRAVVGGVARTSPNPQLDAFGDDYALSEGEKGPESSPLVQRAEVSTRAGNKKALGSAENARRPTGRLTDSDSPITRSTGTRLENASGKQASTPPVVSTARKRPPRLREEAPSRPQTARASRPLPSLPQHDALAPREPSTTPESEEEVWIKTPSMKIVEVKKQMGDGRPVSPLVKHPITSSGSRESLRREAKVAEKHGKPSGADSRHKVGERPSLHLGASKKDGKPAKFSSGAGADRDRASSKSESRNALSTPPLKVSSLGDKLRVRDQNGMLSPPIQRLSKPGSRKRPQLLEDGGGEEEEEPFPARKAMASLRGGSEVPVPSTTTTTANKQGLSKPDRKRARLDDEDRSMSLPPNGAEGRGKGGADRLPSSSRNCHGVSVKLARTGVTRDLKGKDRGTTSSDASKSRVKGVADPHGVRNPLSSPSQREMDVRLSSVAKVRSRQDGAGEKSKLPASREKESAGGGKSDQSSARRYVTQVKARSAEKPERKRTDAIVDLSSSDNNASPKAASAAANGKRVGVAKSTASASATTTTPPIYRHQAKSGKRLTRKDVYDFSGDEEPTPTTKLPRRLSPLKLKPVTSFVPQSRSRDSLPSKPLYRRGQFSVQETAFLEAGIIKFGYGSWREILDHYPFNPGRTSTSLKDKARNLRGRLQ